MRAIVYNVTRAVRIAEPTGIEINVELFTRPTWRVRGGKTRRARARHVIRGPLKISRGHEKGLIKSLHV